MKLDTKHGLTLVEVMIVSSILIFLVILTTAFLRLQTLKSYDSRRKAEIKRIAIAAEEYEKDHNCYPLPSLMVCKPGTGLDPYLGKIPCDPLNGSSYIYEHEDSSCPKWFKLYSILDNESDRDYRIGVGPNSSFNYVFGSSNAPVDAIDGGSGGTGGGGQPTTVFYGCLSGACVPISWDPTRPGPSCDPNYTNPTCYGECINPDNNCQSWK